MIKFLDAADSRLGDRVLDPFSLLVDLQEITEFGAGKLPELLAHSCPVLTLSDHAKYLRALFGALVEVAIGIFDHLNGLGLCSVNHPAIKEGRLKVMDHKYDSLFVSLEQRSICSILGGPFDSTALHHPVEFPLIVISGVESTSRDWLALLLLLP